MGDAVNLAARLMARAGSGHLHREPGLCSTPALTEFDVRPARTVPRQGQAAPSRCRAGTRGARHRAGAAAPRRRVRRPPPTSSRLLRRPARGRVRRARLGDRGRRRHRRREEPASRLELATQRDELRVLRLLCEPFQSDRAYFASSRILRAVFDIPNDADSATAGVLLKERIEAVAPDMLPWLPLVAAATGADAEPTRAVDQLAPQFRTDRLHEAVADGGRQRARPTDGARDRRRGLDGRRIGRAVHVAVPAGRATVPWLICLTTRTTDRGCAPISATRPSGSTSSRSASRPRSSSRPTPAPTIRSPDHLLADIADPVARQPDVRTGARRRAAAAARRSTSCRPRSKPCSRRASTRSPLPTGGCSATSRCSARGSTRRWSKTCSATCSRTRRAPRCGGSTTSSSRCPTASGSATSSSAGSRTKRCPSPAGARCTRDAAEVLERSGAAEVADLLSMHYEAARRFGPAWTYSRLAGDQAPRPLRERRSRDLLPARARRDRVGTAARRRRRRGRRSTRRRERAARPLRRIARRVQGRAAPPRRRRPGDAAPAAQDRDGAGTRRALSLRARLAPPQPRRGAGDLGRARRRAGDDGDRERAVLAGPLRGVHRMVPAGDRRGRTGGRPQRARSRATTCCISPTPISTRKNASSCATARCRSTKSSTIRSARATRSRTSVSTTPRQGEWEDALVVWERGREAFAAAGDVVGAAGMTHNIGEHYSNLGRLEEAEAAQADARRVWTAARYTLGAASATSGLGRTLRAHGTRRRSDGATRGSARHVRELRARDRGRGDRGPHRRSAPAGRALDRSARARRRVPDAPIDGPEYAEYEAALQTRTRAGAHRARRHRSGARVALDASRRRSRAPRSWSSSSRARSWCRRSSRPIRSKPKPIATRPASSSTSRRAPRPGSRSSRSV